MAYVPDDAMRRKRSISHSAWDVYEQLCGWGDPDTGIVEAQYVWNARLVEYTGLKLGTVKNAMTELRRDGWIEVRGERIHLLVGTFLKEVRRLQKEAKEAAKKPSLTSDAPSLTSDAPSLTSDAPSPTNDAPSLVSDDHIDKDRARGSYQTTNQTSDQTKDQTHTHQTSPLRPARAVTGAPVCVCRTKHGSEICDEERIRIASNMPSVENAERYAQSDKVRAGRDDIILLKRRAELGQVGKAGAPGRDTSACPDCRGTGMWYPQGRERGAAQCKHLRLFTAGDASPPAQVAVRGSP